MTDTTLAPFAGWLVKPDWVDRVISRAYDSTSADERRAITRENPFSYINVTRSGEDLADDENLSFEDLVAQSASALTRLLEAEVFSETGRKTFYLYRMTTDSRQQTGIVGTAPVKGFSDGRILTHENVRADRTELLTHHLRGVGATSSPVALAIKASTELKDTLQEITSSAVPDIAFGSDIVHHQVWTVAERFTNRLTELADGETLYVTDGHHRSAAAVRALELDGQYAPFNRTLAVAFPDDQLNIEAFHRLVIDRSNAGPEECIAAISAVASVEPIASLEDARPTKKGQVAIYADRSWHRMTLPPISNPTAVGRLDVERLRCEILDPVLGADELGHGGAVDYLPEPTGFDELVRRCDAEGRVGFVVYPMAINELMAVADEKALMPPKSTFFAPKPRSGAFLRILGLGATSHLNPS